MDELNKLDRKKKLILITSIIILIILGIVSATVAYFAWVGEESSISVTVVGEGSCSVKEDNEVFIEPTETRDGGRIIKFTAEQGLASEAYISWTMTVNEIGGLKDATFKYEMINTTTGTSYGSGNFGDITDGSSITFRSGGEKLAINTKYEFTLYLWIDGTIGNNPLTMADQEFDFDMNCTIFDGNTDELQPYNSIKNIKLYGKTTQDGTPTPENPVELVSLGANGSIEATVGSRNLCNPNAFSYSDYYTVDEDGYITITNTNTTSGNDYRLYPIFSLNVPKGTYTISIETNGILESYISNVEGDYTNYSLTSRVMTLRDTEYIWILIVVPQSTTVKVRFTINAGDTALPYEPYKETILTVSTPNGLKGIPVDSGGNYTDENGQQWISDEIDFARGVYVQRIKQFVFDGTESGWNNGYEGNGKDNRFEIRVYEDFLLDQWTEQSHVLRSGLSNKFMFHYTEGIPSLNKFRGHSTPANGNGCWLLFNPSTDIVPLEDIEAWKTYLNNNNLVVQLPLATPIETPLSAEELAAFAALVDETGYSDVFSDAFVEVEWFYAVEENSEISE